MSTTLVQPVETQLMNLKTTPYLLGLPAIPFAGLFLAALVVGVNTGLLLPCIIVAFAGGYAIRRQQFASAKWEVGGIPTPFTSIVIFGDVKTLAKLIEVAKIQNKRVSIAVGRNAPSVNLGLAITAICRANLIECETTRADHFQVSLIEPVGSMIISSTNRNCLQRDVDSLLKRGWLADGSIVTARSTFSGTEYTQKMMLPRAESANGYAA